MGNIFEDLFANRGASRNGHEDDLERDFQEAVADADRRKLREAAEASRSPADLEYAWKLFEHIGSRDPGAVAEKSDALTTFAECLAIVRKPAPTGNGLLDAALADDSKPDVPF